MQYNLQLPDEFLDKLIVTGMDSIFWRDFFRKVKETQCKKMFTLNHVSKKKGNLPF